MRSHLHPILVLLFIMLLIPAGVQALALYSDGTVMISQPVQDDVFASGGTIMVNARVSSLTAVGGTITINAPVDGDVIAAGGTVTINAPVGGKILVAGGTVEVNAAVGTNAVITGGMVTLTDAADIGKDALISGRTVSSAGDVRGTLTVSSQDFSNTGSAGQVDYTPNEPDMGLRGLFRLFVVLWTIGMFILGLLLIYFIPKRFGVVENAIRTSPVIRTIIGFFAIIVLVIMLVLLSFTIVLLPLTLGSGMLFLLGIMLSTLFVASALGRMIAGYAKWEPKAWQAFTVGFVVLAILAVIPVIGFIVMVIAVSLGFGGILFAVWENRHAISGETGTCQG
jgi:hypothetical protein